MPGEIPVLRKRPDGPGNNRSVGLSIITFLALICSCSACFNLLGPAPETYQKWLDVDKVREPRGNWRMMPG